MITYVIQSGHNVLLKIPSGDIKPVVLVPGSVIPLGRYGSFYADELIGQTYGKRFDINDKHLTELPPMSVEDIEATDATNELINDDKVAPLTTEEIEALKLSGAHASEIIQKQIEQHAAYKLKNEFSKDKYKKRKEAKFSKYFTVIEPTLYNVCEYWFLKDHNRIRDLRIDTLSQMLHLGNVQPGRRYLAVDDVSGLVVAAILDRLNGNGRLLTIGDINGTPAYPVTAQMNIPPDQMSTVHASLNWATAEEDYTPLMLVPQSEREGANDRHQQRLNKRKSTAKSLQQLREELFCGEFDGLLVASQYDPLSILERLEPYLGGSAAIVVYSPHVQVISDLQSSLRDKPQFLGPAVTESWSRQYQVLPGRTHPMMNTSGSGGFLLQTTKIYDDPSAHSVMAHRRKKAEDADPVAADSISSTGSRPDEDTTMKDEQNA